MARIEYDCPLVGEKVQVLAERIIYDDRRLGVKRASPELMMCSHIAKGNCPVRDEGASKSAVKSVSNSNARNCEYLKSLGYHD